MRPLGNADSAVPNEINKYVLGVYQPEIRLYFRFALKITFRRARRNENRA